MKILPVKTFGEFLSSREDGKQAYSIIERDFLRNMHENLFCDFKGVKVLAPSYCDEVFGRIETERPGILVLDQNMGHALKVSFQTVEETRHIQFHFGPPS